MLFNEHIVQWVNLSIIPLFDAILFPVCPPASSIWTNCRTPLRQLCFGRGFIQAEKASHHKKNRTKDSTGTGKKVQLIFQSLFQ